jgi:tetratricopeptide (TPR) repeat protein
MIYSTVYFQTGNYVQMNNGLPSLLDTIFGTKDLSSVSLDEMYELINEFPSFNAAHFLLSKKLKQQNSRDYEKENMRTALYFNNAFWLQTLLEGENKIRRKEISRYVEDENEPRPYSKETLVDEPVARAVEKPHEELSPDPGYVAFESHLHEIISETVSSFDELISKYSVEPLEPEPENVEDSHFETLQETPAEFVEQPIESSTNSYPETKQETPAEFVDQPIESITNSYPETKQETPSALPAEYAYETDVDFILGPAEKIPESTQDSDPDSYETREEIINEYGIFEEVRVKKSDLDLETFDGVVERIQPVNETISDEISQAENESIVENQMRDELLKNQVERDYEAFDRPLDNWGQEEFVEEPMAENQVQYTDDPVGEEHKSIAPFDPKKAESIVFAPYHMIDYFASQGIKLVLEENPTDNFGKQLKSFTDWLKVMKKIPVQPLSEKADEKEADRIRHFASHSNEERDILTESMAEVLAKQGMYENAIALFQKLSLIYPPKSAYFASRIEQLKASLP